MSNVRLGDDILYGAKALAAWMGCSERQIYYWRRLGRFGLFSIGEKVCGRKSKIIAELAKIEAASASEAA
jgi:hypothetical protein